MDMILFKDDWANYPTAIVDYNTTNNSFLRLVKLYKQMGLRNCEFILALYQPALVGVDPFDPNLTQQQKMMISMECKYNPWYYFREVARLPPNSGTVPIRFKANRGNIALYWSFFNHIDFGLLQPRQTGKSASTDVLMNGLMHIWADNTTINLITKDIKLRNANVERLKEMRDLLPDYLYMASPLDADNTELITCIRLGNRYKTAVGRNDRMAADKLGRGLTVPIMQFDELAYINLIEVSLPVALSSGSEARDQAKNAQQPYGNIFTTTAGNINSRDGKFAYTFMTGGISWSESFFDVANQKTLVKVVEKGSTGLKPLIYGSFNHRQLGRTDEWMYGKLRESASSGELADRDYFNIWTTGTEGSPMSMEEKQAIKQSEREPEYTEITPEGYVIRWFIPRNQIVERMATGRYSMGIDPSEALGKDNDATGMVVVDIETHDVVCTGRYNETSIPILSQFFANFLIRYANVTMVIERKSSGISMLDELMIHLTNAGVDPFKRIYNLIVDEQEEFRSEFREIQMPVTARQPHFYSRFKRYFGFNTTGSGKHSRDSLYSDALQSFLKYGVKRVHDNILINELLSLSIKNGRIDHSAGNHDDMVVSLLLAHWLCIRGKHLTYYGINPLGVFSRALTREEEMSAVDRLRDQRVRQYREEFTRTMDALKNSEDIMEITRLEAVIRRLSQHVDLSEKTGVGIDALLQQAREERQRRNKVRRFNVGGSVYRVAA